MALNNSGTQDWAPECPNVKKIKNGPSDRYDTERFGRLIFARIRKSVRLKGLSIRLRVQPIKLEGLSTFYAICPGNRYIAPGACTACGQLL